QYTYNADGDLVQTQAPGGRTISSTYTPGGLLSSVTSSAGTVQYGYSPSKQLTSLDAPGGENLALAFDGGLLGQTSWTGPVAGTVERGYGNDLVKTSEGVNGGSSVSIAYDSDGLRDQVGALSLTRSTQNSLVTGATLGSVSSAWTYNTFGELASESAS